MNVELKCEKCLGITELYFPNTCFDCRKEECKNDPVMIEMKRQDKWKSRKRFAYHMLLYIPLPVVLGLVFGLSINIAFVAGTIYASLLPIMIDWCVDIF